MKTRMFAVTGVIIGLTLAMGLSAAAAERTWDGGGTDSIWSLPANWDGNATAPVAGDELFFDGEIRLTNANDLAAGTSFAGITFNELAGAFVLSGNAITLAGDIYNLSTNTQTINVPMTLDAGRTVYGAGVTNTILGGTISGSGGLTVNRDVAGSTPTLTLSGDNSSYTGNITVTGNSRLNIGHANALGGGTLVITNGYNSFDNTTGAPLTIANNLTLSNQFSFDFIGTHDLAILGVATVTGGDRSITVTDGTLTLASIDADATTRNLTKALGENGTLHITGPAGANFQGNFRFSDALVLGHKDAVGPGRLELWIRPNLQASADLSGVNRLANEVWVTRDATVSGANNIEFGGEFYVDGNGSRTLTNSLANGKLLTLNDLDINRHTGAARTLTFAGTGDTRIEGGIANGNEIHANSLVKNGSGRLIVNGDNTYTGNTTINEGTFVAGHSNATGTVGTITVNSGGAFAVANDITFDRPVTFNQGSAIGGQGIFDRGESWLLPANFTVAPGLSTGTLTIDLNGGILTMNGTTTTMIEIGALNDYDILHILGEVVLAGDLEVSMLGGFVPIFGSVFDVITADANDGLSGDINLTGPYASWFTAAIVDGDTLQLTSIIPEPTSGLLLALAGLAFMKRRRR